MIVYVITNLLDGKKYVGQTTRTLEQRFKEHRANFHSYLGRAINEYGAENFKAETLEQCASVDELTSAKNFG